MRAGACDYIEYPFKPEEVVEHIDAIADPGGIDLDLREKTYEAFSRVEQLTQREKEILECISNGQTSKQMARDLSLSHRTVEIYRAMIIKKLDVANSSEAAALGLLARMTRAFRIH